jgi:N-acetylneuraminic acid mutarotase
MQRALRVLGVLVVTLALGCGEQPGAPGDPGGESRSALGAQLEAALTSPALHLGVEPPGGAHAFKPDGDAYVHGAKGAAPAAGGTPGPQFEARVERDGTVSVRAHDAMGGVRLRPRRSPLQPGSPSLRDDRVVFPAGDAAIVYRARANGLKEDIVLARARGDALDFEWELLLDEGLEATIDQRGNVNVYGPENLLWSDIKFSDDATRQAVERARHGARKTQLLYRIPAPIIRDATGSVGGEGRFELRGRSLTLRAAKLQALSYPITIDPTVTVSSTADFAGTGNLEANVVLGSGQISRPKTRLGGATWTGTTALAVGRYGHSMVAHNDYLYVLGGYTASGYVADVSVAPINPDGTIAAWAATTALPQASAYMGVVAYNGSMYLVGGYSSTTGYSAGVWRSVIGPAGTLGSWERLGDLPVAVYQHGLAAYGGYLYVAGGYNSADGILANVYSAAVRGDGSLGSWTPIGSLPEGIRRHGFVAHLGWLYVVGGTIASTAYSDGVYRARLTATGSHLGWQSSALLPSGRYSPGVTAYGGYLYSVGGSGSSGNFAEALAIRIDATGNIDDWITVSTDAVVQRRFAPAIAYRNYLYVAGGYTTSADNQVLFSPLDQNGTLIGRTWGSATATWSARYGHTMHAHNGYLFVIGGYDGAYQPTTYSAPITPTGTIGSWTARSSLSSGRYKHASVIANGFLYVLGGQTGASSHSADVLRAAIAEDGSLGTFSVVAAFGGPRRSLGAAVVNGYMYVIGGRDSSTFYSDVQYAPINPDGSLGAFAATTSMTNPRSAHAVAAYNGRIYVLGGYDSVLGRTGTILYATPSSTGTISTWTTAAVSLPEGREGHAAEAHNGYLYVLGGYSSLYSSDVLVSPINYTGALVGFTLTGNMPAGRHLFGSTIHNGTIYGSGGADPGGHNDVWWVRPHSHGTLGGWVVGSPLPTARRYHVLAAANGYLYAIGGHDGTSYLSSIVRASISTTTGALGSWTTISPSLPAVRSIAAVAVVGGYLYVIGGSASAGSYATTVYYTTLNANGSLGSWQTTTPLPVARGLAAASVHAGKFIYVTGGYSPGSGHLATTVWAQVASDGTIAAWNAGTDMPGVRSYHGQVTHNAYLYVVGGHDGSAAHATVWSASLSSDGTMGTWSAQNPLPVGGYYMRAFAAHGFLYVLGGYNGRHAVWVAPILPGGKVGNWTNTADLKNERYGTDVEVYDGRAYVVGGADSTGPISTTEYAPLNTPASVGDYSKLIDLNTIVSVDQFYWTGSSYNGRVRLLARVAPENGVFGTLMDLGEPDRSAWTTFAGVNARYLWVRLVLDDSRSDFIAPEYSWERNVSLFYVNYTDRCASVTCTPLSQCHDVGVCDPYTGTCSNPPRSAGAACNDSNACTQTDQCDGNGTCVGSNPVECAALDQCHLVGTCQPATGQCSNPPKTDGSACSDENACTLTDTCQAGVCTGGNAVICTASDQCHNVGTCNPSTGICSNPPKADGTACVDGNACSQTDTCQAGACTGGNWKVCTASDQCHVAGTCDPATGNCSNPNQPNGTTCNDGNACSQTDTCQTGVCTGSGWVTCTPLGQCYDVGTCDPGTGVCSNPYKPSSAGCDDGKSCTTGDHCDGAGTCIAGTSNCSCTSDAQCPPPNDCTNQGTCNIGTGVCSYTSFKTSGTACNDGNLCTQTDQCNGSGTCVGSNPKTCNPLDQCHNAGTCNPADGVCSNPAKTDGTTCNDSNACTQTDTCQGGNCVGANPVVCTALGQCYNVGTCNTSTGQCSNPPKTAGTSCNDSDLCTQTDQCNGGGTCVGSNPVACPAPDQCHDLGTCQPATGTCTNPPKANGTTCSDGDGCTQTDTCQSGVCTGANPKTCTALDQCHVPGTCQPATGTCTNPAATDGTTCNDGNACTQTDTCQSGTCTGANPKTCTALDQCHNAGTCDPGTGNCSNPNKSDGTACNDGNACTQSDTCQAGTCTGANPVVCVALDQCHTAGTCNTGTGVCTDPIKTNGSACDDGDLCTQTDTCQSGVCTGANPRTCTASDQCHDVGTCDPASGLCSSPPKTDGTGCNDSSLCTTGETCQAGVCGSPTSTVTCSALDQCHDVGTCDPATGSCSNPVKPNGSACDDGRPCTTGDKCQAGACVPDVNDCGCATSADCVALDQCHDNGTCGGDFKCTYPVKNDGTTCNDNNPCTQTDTCQAGVCTGANPRACAAPDQCHDAGSCDPGSGNCTYPNKEDGTSCNDGNGCTEVDACMAGICVGSQPKICAGDQCRSGGTCDPSTGQCTGTPKEDGTVCNDANACTQNDQCTAGTCGGTAVTCVALDSCHNVGTCNPTTGLCTNPPKLNGADCDDGNACTTGEKCTSGVCSNPTSTRKCDPTDACHAAGVCDPETGQCSNPIRPNGTPCNDLEGCTAGETCQAGTCTPTTTDCSCSVSGDCPPVNQCQIAVVCNSSNKCEYILKTNGTTCDDGDACTTGETCTDGVCGSPTSVVQCTALDQCHDIGACDPATGQCTDPIKADGASCDDQVACTTGDACQAGVCVLSVNDCACADDGDCPAPTPCYEQGTCNGSHRCVYAPKPDGTPCDDGNACTSGESCQGGMCEAPTQVVTCDPLDSCHEAGVCDVATGRCSDPIKADSSSCDDQNACTAGETCQGGICGGGAPICEDGGVDGGQTDGGQTDGGVDARADGAPGDDGGALVDGGTPDGAAPEDGPTSGDAAPPTTEKSKSYLACATAAPGGAASGLGLALLGLAGLLLGRRRRR